VHVANFVEESFHDQGFPGRHYSEGIHARLQVVHQLRSTRARQADLVYYPLHCRVGRIGNQ